MATKITDFQAEELLVEIITGKKLFYTSSGQIMAVRFPTTEERDRARIVYSKNVHELKASGIPTIDEMRERIKQLELLPLNYYRLLDGMKFNLDSYRKAYDSTASEMQRKQLAVDMEKIESEILEHDAKERSILCNTAEIQAENVKIDYLVSRCTLCGDELNVQYWKTYEDFRADSDVKNVSVSRYNFIVLMAGIPPATIRAVARTQEWRNRWKSLKDTGASIFGGPSSEWDKNKVAICYWSDFYDSIYSYSTPPPEEVIEDDDRLFEWIRDVNRLNSARNKKTSEKGAVEKKVKAPYKVRPVRPNMNAEKKA